MKIGEKLSAADLVRITQDQGGVQMVRGTPIRFFIENIENEGTKTFACSAQAMATILRYLPFLYRQRHVRRLGGREGSFRSAGPQTPKRLHPCHRHGDYEAEGHHHCQGLVCRLRLQPLASAANRVHDSDVAQRNVLMSRGYTICMTANTHNVRCPFHVTSLSDCM